MYLNVQIKYTLDRSTKIFAQNVLIHDKLLIESSHSVLNNFVGYVVKASLITECDLDFTIYW